MNYAKYNFAYSLTLKGMIHMSINKKKISLLTALIIAFSSFSPAFAAKSVSDLKKAINDRDKSIKQTEKKINDKKAEKDQEVEKRNNLDIQISAVLDDISDTEAIISEKDQKISAKTAEINELSTQIEENNNKLKNRLKVIYEYGATSYLQLLLESNGLADLVTRLSVVKQVYNYDKSVIADYISAKQTVEDARQVIQNEQNEQLEAKGILESKKANLESLKSEKQKLIYSINSDIKSLEKEEQQKEDDLTQRLQPKPRQPQRQSQNPPVLQRTRQLSRKVRANFHGRPLRQTSHRTTVTEITLFPAQDVCTEELI